MGHDATKVLLGSTLSSAKDISVHDSDPASFPAGVAVSLGSDQGLSLLKSAGMRIGISIGKSLSDTKKTAVCRSGESVPVKVASKRASGTVTITSYANLVSGTDDSLSVAGTAFTAQTGAAALGDATFQAATSNNATATSLAAQINGHATVGLKVKAVALNAVVTLYSIVEGVGSTGTGNDIAVSYTDNDTNVGLTLAGLSGGKLSGGLDTVAGVDFVTKGAKVYINDTTGKADVAGFGTISDAVYVSAALTAVDETGTESGVAALVDMPGGL